MKIVIYLLALLIVLFENHRETPLDRAQCQAHLAGEGERRVFQYGLFSYN